MKQPVWYRKGEQLLLDNGGGTLIIALLVVLVVVSCYFIWHVAHGRKLLPAATWTVYSYLP
jgi:hypothetical protein